MMLQDVIIPDHHTATVRDGESYQGTGAHHERRRLRLSRLLNDQLRGEVVLLVSRDGLVGVVVDVNVWETLNTLWRGGRRGNG